MVCHINMKKEYIWLLVAALCLVIGACTITIQIQRDNTNSSFENSSTSSNSADSASIDLKIK
jgi:hypothetical protein